MHASHAAVSEAETKKKSISPLQLTPQIRTVVDYLQEYGEMSDEELQELLNIKKTRSYLLARQMSDEGLIEIIGRGPTKKYRLK